jgi:serpin B
LSQTEQLLQDFDLSSINFEAESDTEVTLPKFKLESFHQLREPLEKLEISSLFKENDADLTGISQAPGLFVSSVIQKAVIEVNEQGTEAAVASAVSAEVRSIGIFPANEFLCNRPFLYFIRDSQTGSVLFFGRVMNPLQS